MTAAPGGAVPLQGGLGWWAQRTRLFSVLYHRTLNVGRVLSPTLALIVQREAEIAAFQPEPFYTVVLGLSVLPLPGKR